MSNDEQVDYEDLTTMRLDDEGLAELLTGPAECVFNWTTKDGHPVGVVVASCTTTVSSSPPAPSGAHGCPRCGHGPRAAS